VDDVLRQRLEALNRGPLPGAAVVNRSNRVNIAAKPSAKSVAAQPRNLTESSEPRLAACAVGLMQSGDVVGNAAGKHLRIRLPLETLWPGGTVLAAQRIEHLHLLAATAEQAIEPTIVLQPEFAALVAALPDRAVMLDLETCGLAGSALFLVGLLRQIGGKPTIELLVARDYAEESAVLATFWQTVPDSRALVTYNGKSFDWPMMLDRSTRHRLAVRDAAAKLVHIDLLHHARRRWRRQLPDCRLQTLEQLICRRRRRDDIPGHRIPAAYAEFVRTGFEREMDAILFHNALDLVTLFDLSLRLAA
jgi:uncharacterized protein YprB with RNaseH-like and TPR domain